MPFNSILVLGAGELGTPVLQSLASHPKRADSPITVMLRFTSDPAKQSLISSFKALDISILPGDLGNASEDELTALFAPFHTIIGCTGMAFPVGSQLKIARAVLTAKTPRYFPWQFGVDYDVIGPGSSQNLFAEQLEVRALLRNQTATRWVIVSTGMFTSFLFEPSFGVVNAERTAVHALGSWENKVTVTTPNDIGLVVAELVLDAPDAEGVVFIAGDTITYGRLAEVVAKTLGKPITKEEWTVDFLRTQLAEDPDNGLKKYQVVFAEGRGVSWDVDKSFNVQRHLKLMNVEEWAKANLHT